ncbi:phospholipase A1-like [Euwallacea fornicatus]|uniref:phospholipase A1-like n=1 Tax=Euwallacea fornicatus TaxID=995702 RepID=UPI00338E3E33
MGSVSVTDFLLSILYIQIGCLNTVKSFHLYIGDCPIYLYERCTHSEAVRFTLSLPRENESRLYDLDPLNPELPIEYNPLIPTKVVVHGYGGLDIDTSTSNVTRTYQDVGYNVIIVDWESLAQIPCYTTAYLNTWYVAQCISLLMVGLIPLGMNPQTMHVIGFSLGAHVSGLAGNNLRKTLGASFYRITGLDPALPFFATLKNDWKLDKSDADFVDVIHTSAGTFGKLEATGHVDFYVNGGSLQPACQSKKYPPLCSHIMAGLYFSESIRNSVLGGNSFIARKCDNIVNYVLGLCNGIENNMAIMGENVYYLTRGIYYLETADQPPYALGFKSYHFKNSGPRNIDFLENFNRKLKDFFSFLC